MPKINVRNWENGRARPDIDRLPVLVAVLRLDRIDDLFGVIGQRPEYSDPDQCAAKTKSSGYTEQCKQMALRDSFWCAMHSEAVRRGAE